MCSGSACGHGLFDCLDPDADDEFHECEEPPPSPPACSAEVQREWVVGDAAQARALTTAVNCSGGLFEVEWRGSIVVDEAIYVADGTALTISGAAGSMATIDGNSSTRLFTVVNAALHLDGLNVSYGASTVGGAIAATGSTLSFNRTNFVGNSASVDGGAVYASDASSVFCTHGTTFVENTAGVVGGAMLVSRGSLASCGGTWLRNSAGARGGALRLVHESRASWSEESVFDSNAAGLQGGALSVVNSSSVSWDAPTGFYYNSAVYGGALSLSNRCVASWQARTGFFSNRVAESGAAVYARTDSNVSWSGDTHTVFDGHQALREGGALAVQSGSHVSCTADTTTTFSSNSASDGGAIFVEDSASLSFDGACSFEDNAAVGDLNGVGGAVFLDLASAAFYGAVNFTGNRAEYGGGALCLFSSNVVWSTYTMTALFNAAAVGGVMYSHSSSTTWNGPTTMAFNNASELGGGVSLLLSNASWVGQTNFSGNWARLSGGALTVGAGSVATWSGDAVFTNNLAGHEDDDLNPGWGGALHVENSSEVSWSGDTLFEGNDAVVGGALFVRRGSYVGWTGSTIFSSNAATADGGAVVSPESDPEYNPLDSTLHIGATTTFFNNTSGTNGGGLSLLGACSLDVDHGVAISYIENSAVVAGGAVFVSGAGSGPSFSGATFVANSAQVGGAVSTFGSGNSKSVSEAEPPDPTTYDRCRFVGNTATTGGAIDSAAGYDSVIDSVFEANAAGAGGALRLAGTAAIDGCSFVENFSDDGGGAVVSNIGTIARMANISFGGNGFNCPAGMFLDYNTVRRWSKM